MTKKVLSIVLSVIMLLGTFAVAVSAQTDYKYEIDNKFFKAYLTGEFNQENVDENLRFWSDEIIAEYNAAKTNEDYRVLYEKMCTPYDNEEDYADFWYMYRDESKAIVTVNYVASASTVAPGETFTVKSYVTTNFYTIDLELPIFYDKTLFTLENCEHNLYNETTNPDGIMGMSAVYNSNWGFNAQGADRRSYYWPDSMQSADAYAKYGAARSLVSIDASVTPAGYNVPRYFDNTLYATYTFKVKDTAALGSNATFFMPEDSFPALDIDSLDSDWPTTAALVRGINSTDITGETADETAGFGVTSVITNANVTVGSAVEYADYTALDAAIAEITGLTQNNYTSETWTNYAAAVSAGSALSRELTADEQGTVDAATQAIVAAKAALLAKEVISAEVVGTPALNMTANVNVTVAGSPDKLSFVGSDGVSTILDRNDAQITKDGDKETWAVKLFADSLTKDYTVYASYDGAFYDGSSKTFTINANDEFDLSIHSVYIPDMEDGNITSGKHTIIVKTSTDVAKVQVLDPNYNSTCTYGIAYTPYEDNGNERTWTITFNFTPLGEMNNIFRTRAATTTFAETGVNLTANVLY